MILNQNKVVSYILDLFKDSIMVAFEEEPERFKYTLYIINMMDNLDFSFNDLSNNIFDKIINEFSDYLYH